MKLDVDVFSIEAMCEFECLTYMNFMYIDGGKQVWPYHRLCGQSHVHCTILLECVDGGNGQTTNCIFNSATAGRQFDSSTSIVFCSDTNNSAATMLIVRSALLAFAFSHIGGALGRPQRSGSVGCATGISPLKEHDYK